MSHDSYFDESAGQISVKSSQVPIPDVQSKMVSILGILVFGLPWSSARTIDHGVRYLYDGKIRLGVDLDKGGSITYLAKSGGENIVYDYRYDLVVGSLEEIRRCAYTRLPRLKPPAYRFRSDRQHWSYVNCEDAGWPIRGSLDVKLERNDPQMVGPEGIWRAGDAPKLMIDAAFSTHGDTAQLFWSRFR